MFVLELLYFFLSLSAYVLGVSFWIGSIVTLAVFSLLKRRPEFRLLDWLVPQVLWVVFGMILSFMALSEPTLVTNPHRRTTLLAVGYLFNFLYLLCFASRTRKDIAPEKAAFTAKILL